MRIFLDANILFSAANPKSRTRALLELLFQHAECITNLHALEEARGNLASKQPVHVTELLEMTARLEMIPGLITNLGVKLAAKDALILEGAIAGHATHLLTGDEKDFGPFFGKQFKV